ncbi:hypothetical protein DRE_02694 [Drechslerella stenobrocha 248]|uniref:Phospholipid:diacylglycerol acyltransferase n=1 Tax=Drechslerella stenobrocha 248 TaxID=1043628 RepID=W7IG15_9PEZI|nr:hypothetical protein DRE_02694 [Drechslerella stenobrocha 248]
MSNVRKRPAAKVAKSEDGLVGATEAAKVGSTGGDPPQAADVPDTHENQLNSTAAKGHDDDDDNNGKSRLRKSINKHRKHSHNTLFFVIGSLVGVFIAVFFLKQQDIVTLPDFNLEYITDVLPVGILNEARDISTRQKDAVNYDSFAIGLRMKEEGLQSHFPVVMIPGVISTGLESWGTSAKSLPYFRKRLWGSFTMMRTLMLDKALWKDHIMLNKTTGLDPDGIKLRAAQGFDATDFFVTGYWIWSKILENLATLGYDPTTSYTAAYDWRLSYINLEKRDQYFTRLKNHIEIAKKVHKRKCILTSHSMGSQVVFFFFKWVEAMGEDMGNGGPTWVEDHIEAWINISGSLLGAVKGVTAVLSGEMRDTVQLNQFAVYGLERFFSREERAEILRSMPGISSMIPKGGEAVWGNHTWAPDDLEGQTTSYGNFIKFKSNNDSVNAQNLTVTGALNYLLETSEPWFKAQLLGSYSHGLAGSIAEAKENERDPTKWINPLEVPLPYAPNMKIYCFYGVGKLTERSYYYTQNAVNGSFIQTVIDPTVTRTDESTDHGVVMGEGDGTVPLLSMGFMASKGWKMKRFNPAGIAVKTFEMLHEPQSYDMRGGPNTADHVDILGRQQLNELILRVAAGRGDMIPEKKISDIDLYTSRVDLGGVDE